MPLDAEDAVLDKTWEREGLSTKKVTEEQGPLYRVVGDSKIPVSKASGTLWQSRRDQGVQARINSKTCWDEAIKYYDNDQSMYRRSRENSAGNTLGTQQLGNQYSETENVVFSNCSIQVPMLYAKNPTISVTYEADQLEALGKCIEKVGNKLLSMKNAPGLNMKPKMRRTVLTTLLTNNAFMKIGWTQKIDSNAEALAELEELSKELVAAKTKAKVKEAEGKIKALEEKVNLLTPAGPWARALGPDRVVVDPTANEPDGSDANWMMEWDYLPTSYINAVYAKMEDGQYRSIYEPTHIMKAGCTTDQGVEDEVNNFTLVKDDVGNQPGAYGYNNKAQFDAASYTKIWWVWDKTTRRVLMFADNNWKWPIWVWDDPLKLPRFFPYFRLWFHESVDGTAPKGEVTYYLDQQDRINTINSEVNQGRRWARRNIFYDLNSISQDDVEAVLKGPDGTARGVKLSEGATLDKAIMSITPPSLKFPELFNTDSAFAAIDRITGINQALRGGQFKTNTTNKAVETYNQNTDIRVEERVDLIEDFVGDVMWNIIMLCMMNWDTQDVVPIVGQQVAQAWKRITDPREFETMFNARVEGGSIAKPNSQTKKQQAIQLAQAMGQFANAAPAVIVVMMKMMERAFNDSVVISDEDWNMIIETMMMSLTKAGSGPGAGSEQGGAPPTQEGGPLTDEEMKAQLAEQIRKMPPAAQEKLQELVQQGMPPAEALKQVQAELSKVQQ